MDLNPPQFSTVGRRREQDVDDVRDEVRDEVRDNGCLRAAMDVLGVL